MELSLCLPPFSTRDVLTSLIHPIKALLPVMQLARYIEVQDGHPLVNALKMVRRKYPKHNEH